MPGTVKSELLPDADRSHKCDCQEKVSWKRNLPLDKSHFITEKPTKGYFPSVSQVTILALQYPDSGKLSTDVPDVDTGIDWLVYLAQYSQQCQAQSRFGVRRRLDIVENTEIMAGPNQSFYCGTL